MQPELSGVETRPGPEDAEGSTRRWSFRSRKANQLQPYRFDRLQYKRQLRWNPDAVVAAPSPPRRRSSHGSTTDQEFIADHGEADTQETGELSGLTITEEDETQSQSRDTYRPGRVVPSTVIPPTLPTPQWFLDGMDEISDADSDEGDDVAGYLAGYSHKKPVVAGLSKNGRTPGVSRWLLGSLRNLMHQLGCRQTR